VVCVRNAEATIFNIEELFDVLLDSINDLFVMIVVVGAG